MVESQLEEMRQGTGSTAMTSSAVVGDPGGAGAHRRTAAAARAGARARLHRQAPGDRSRSSRRSRRRDSRAGGDEQGTGEQQRPSCCRRTRCTGSAWPDRDAARLRISTLQRAVARTRSTQIARVPEPRRSRADGRAGAGLAHARVELERARYTDLKNTLRQGAQCRGPRAQAGGRAVQRALPGRLPGAPAHPSPAAEAPGHRRSSLGFVLGAARRSAASSWTARCTTHARCRASSRFRCSARSRRFTAPRRPVTDDTRGFMSRIQDILSKAERDGTVRRTRGSSTTA